MCDPVALSEILDLLLHWRFTGWGLSRPLSLVSLHPVEEIISHPLLVPQGRGLIGDQVAGLSTTYIWALSGPTAPQHLRPTRLLVPLRWVLCIPITIISDKAL